MGKFNEYSQKATPADNDTMMIYDATSKSNKLSPFSGIWNWIVEKLTNAVISNLRTNNQTVLGAINEVNGSLPAVGIYDLDNPPKKMIFSARAGSTNLPNDFSGANAVTVIQMNLGNDSYDSMIAFTFAVDKIAIRRKNGTKNWSEWKYFNTAEILSNLTTTNKSSLVGAINELNSNRFKANSYIISSDSSAKTVNIKWNNTNEHMVSFLLIDSNNYVSAYVTGKGSGVVEISKGSGSTPPVLDASSATLKVTLVPWSAALLICFDPVTIS